jgi:hypothetical protein
MGLEIELIQAIQDIILIALQNSASSSPLLLERARVRRFQKPNFDKQKV